MLSQKKRKEKITLWKKKKTKNEKATIEETAIEILLTKKKKIKEKMLKTITKN